MHLNQKQGNFMIFILGPSNRIYSRRQIQQSPGADKISLEVLDFAYAPKKCSEKYNRYSMYKCVIICIYTKYIYIQYIYIIIIIESYYIKTKTCYHGVAPPPCSWLILWLTWPHRKWWRNESSTGFHPIIIGKRPVISFSVSHRTWSNDIQWSFKNWILKLQYSKLTRKRCSFESPQAPHKS